MVSSTKTASPTGSVGRTDLFLALEEGGVLRPGVHQHAAAVHLLVPVAGDVEVTGL